MVHTPNPSRERDDEVLKWIEHRAAGHSLRQVAEKFGSKSSLVSAATCNILAADLEYSGEPRAAVLGAYW